MNEQLAAIRARRAAITPGAWQLVEMGRDFAVFAPHPVESGNTCIAVVDGGLTADSKRDGEFIAAAPADIDTLLAMVDALTVCAQCGGTGVVDSGGFTPWGAPIDIECSGCFGHATVESAVSEISRLRLAVDALTAERDALAAQLAQAQRELAAADMALMDAIHERE